MQTVLSDKERLSLSARASLTFEFRAILTNLIVVELGGMPKAKQTELGLTALALQISHTEMTF